MKKSVNIIALVSVLAIALCAAVTVCWLDDSAGSVSFDEHFHGSTESAYFAGGTGDVSSPYIITDQVHLYNLAWLQYLGYFNGNATMNNGRKQSFFVLGADVAVDGYTLPPIGTAEYPFIGGFDGKGYKISGLKTSNMQSSFGGVYPGNARFNGSLRYSQNNADNEVSIVGLFGIVGDYGEWVTNKYSSGVTVNKYGSDGATLKELPDTVGENELYYSGMYVKNLYLDAVETETCSGETTIGIAAGYVAATVQNVGVRQATVTIAETVSGAISEYTLIGNYDASAVGWEDSGSTADPDEWGGTIDMRTLNRRLNYMFTAGTLSAVGSYTNRKSESSVFNTNLYHSTGNSSGANEFYWNDDTAQQRRVYLSDGTAIPPNVDTTAMGLDSFTVTETTEKAVNADADDAIPYGAEFTVANKGSYHINKAYYNRSKSDSEVVTGEKVLPSNTGYMVGGGTDGSAVVRSGMFGINRISGYNSSTGTIKMYTIKYGDTAKTEILDGDENKEQANYYASLGLTKYNDVKTEMLEVMNGASYVHGFHFNQALPFSELADDNKIEVDNVIIDKTFYSTTITKEYLNGLSEAELAAKDLSGLLKLNFVNSKYQFVKSGINFTIDKTDSIRVVLGSFYSASAKQTLFDLFEVERDSRGQITGYHRVNEVYRYNGEVYYDYDENKPDGATCVFEFSPLVKKQCLDVNQAYYFEIPVRAGDYVIGTATDSLAQNAYLMYLGVGAGGGSDDNPDQQTVYGIDMLHFVGEIPELLGAETTGKWRVFNDYTTASVKLNDSTATATIELLRDEATDAGTSKIDTTLRYAYINVTATGAGNTAGKERTTG